MRLKGYYIIGVICILLFIAWTALVVDRNVGHLRTGNGVIPILLPPDVPDLTIFHQNMQPLASLHSGVRVRNLCLIWFFNPSKKSHGHYPIEDIQIAVLCSKIKPLTLAYQKLGEPPRYWIYVDGKPQISTEKEIMDVLERADKQRGT